MCVCVQDIRLNYFWELGFKAGAMGNVKHSFIAITPWSTLTMGQIEMFNNIIEQYLKLTVYKQQIGRRKTV